MGKISPLILAMTACLALVSCKKESGSTVTTLTNALAQAWNYVEENSAEDAAKEAALAKLPRGKTLYLVGFQWGEPHSFNPLNGYPDWPSRPEFNLMYEHLTEYNSMTGELQPSIGRIERANKDYVSVILNPLAKWSDGRPLTADDVLFSYNLNLTNSDAPCSYIQGFVKELTVDTLKTVIKNKSGDSIGVKTEERVYLWVDKEDRNNPLSVLDQTSTVPILPKHVFEPLLRAAGGSISRVADDPMMGAQIISGPYNLYMASNEKIVIRRRDDYWGNEAYHDGKVAAPEFIVHAIYKGNEHASAALKNGELDISSNYTPRIWLKENVKTWFDAEPYFLPGSIPMFIINTTRPPLDNKHYRRAMAFAIDYEKIKKLAVSGYTTDVQSGLILPFSAESTYFSQEEVDKYGATRYDPERAKEELKLGGFKPIFDKKKNNLLFVLSNARPNTDKNGSVLKDKFGDTVWVGDTMPTVGIMSPSGWTDFESVVRIAITGMRAVGIDVRPNFVDDTQYWPAQTTGNFDLFFDTPIAMLSKSTPWSRFEGVMSARNWKPVGQKMYENIGRWNDPNSENFIPQIDSLLHKIPLMESESEKKKAYTLLNRYFMEEQPTLPVLYRPEEYYEFSTKYWTNFPTAANPYAPPRMPVASAGTRLLWEIVSTTGGN